MEGEPNPKLGVPFSDSSEKKFSCLVVPRLRHEISSENRLQLPLMHEKGDFYPLLCRVGMTL